MTADCKQIMRGGFYFLKRESYQKNLVCRSSHFLQCTLCMPRKKGGAPCVRCLGDTIFDVFSQSISRLCTALKSLHFVTAINIRRHGMGREWVHCNVRWWWSVPTSWNMNPCDICLVMLSPHLLLAQRNMKTQDANKKEAFWDNILGFSSHVIWTRYT